VLSLDPIGKYADLLRWALWAVLAGGLFVTGCNHGQTRQTAKDQQRIDNLVSARDSADADAAENLRAANACGLLLNDVNDQSQRQIDEAARAKETAEQAASRAQVAAAAGQRRAKAAEQALQDAKTMPECRTQLEMPLCASIPLL
jgi:hypothetical protein